MFSQEYLATLYNDCIRPAITLVRHSEVAHWPVSYDAEYKRLQTPNGLGQSTYPVSSNIIQQFGEELMDNIHDQPWGVGAFFFHQIRSVRAVYPHQSHESNNTLQRLLNYHFIPNSVNQYRFWVDVGMEFMKTSKVLWWREDAHWRMIQRVLNLSEQEARRAVTSSRYTFDAACQLTEVGGCRFVPSVDQGAESGAVYIQLYNTEKQVTYSVNRVEKYNSKHLDIASSILDSKYISTYFNSVHSRFKDARRNFEGYARLEVRLPLWNANYTTFDGNAADLAQSLISFKNSVWW